MPNEKTSTHGDNGANATKNGDISPPAAVRYPVIRPLAQLADSFAPKSPLPACSVDNPSDAPSPPFGVDKLSSAAIMDFGVDKRTSEVPITPRVDKWPVSSPSAANSGYDRDSASPALGVDNSAMGPPQSVDVDKNDDRDPPQRIDRNSRGFREGDFRLQEVSGHPPLKPPLFGERVKGAGYDPNEAAETPHAPERQDKFGEGRESYDDESDALPDELDEDEVYPVTEDDSNDFDLSEQVNHTMPTKRLQNPWLKPPYTSHDNPAAEVGRIDLSLDGQIKTILTSPITSLDTGFQKTSPASSWTPKPALLETTQQKVPLTKIIDPQELPRSIGSGVRGPGPSEEVLDLMRRVGKSGLANEAEAVGIGAGQHSQASSTPSPYGGISTVSRSTMDVYQRRGRSLLKRYRREMQLTFDAEISPVHFANWALSIKMELRTSTWRIYRQAVLHLLQAHPGHDAQDAIRLIETDIASGFWNPRGQRYRPHEIAHGGAPKTPGQQSGQGSHAERASLLTLDDTSWLEPPPSAPNTEVPADDAAKSTLPKAVSSQRRSSALKEKRFPLDDLRRVLTYLKLHSKSEYALTLADWIRAGLLTALRPSEWRCTDLVQMPDASSKYGRRVYLYVLNAKATNGRTTGPVRTLDLSDFGDDHLDTVRRMSLMGRSLLERGIFDQRQAACSNLLFDVCRKLWPSPKRPHYAMYSSRHQAIANWKAIMSLPEIAALVGHAVSRSSDNHYAKRRSSWAPSEIPPPPKPVPEELSLVRDRMRMWTERMESKKYLGLIPADTNTEYPIG